MKNKAAAKPKAESKTESSGRKAMTTEDDKMDWEDNLEGVEKLLYP
jgi:hypothetical protein